MYKLKTIYVKMFSFFFIYTMEEEDYNCPVCHSVFRAEIYQCSAGHVVCSGCYKKVTTCPVCREKYGKRIRSRPLEKVLDNKEFDCEFKDNGCKNKCKRSELTNHENSCGFSPDLFPLCEMMGWEKCKFVLGASSKRAEIITHFQEVHELCVGFGEELTLSLNSIVAGIEEIMSKKQGDDCLANIITPTREESSPLFLVIGKVNCSTKSMSFLCIQIWRARASPKYMVNFSLSRDHPLIVNWTLNVYSLKEAEHTLEACPINIPISVLEHGVYGENGKLCINVSQVYN